MSMALESSSLIGNSFKYIVSCPGCDEERQRDVFFMLATNYKMLAKPLAKQKSLRMALESGACQSLGFESLHKRDRIYHDLCYHSSLLDLYETFFGTSSTIALCNVIAIENEGLRVATDHNIWASSAVSGSFKSASPQTSPGADLGDTHAAPVHSDPNRPAEPKTSNPPTNEASSQSVSEQATKEKENVHVPSNDVNESGDKSDENAAKKPEQGPSSDTSAAAVDNEAVADSAEDSDKDADRMREPPKVVHVTPSSASHVSSSTGETIKVSNGNGNQQKPQPPMQKESVWQKLSNKIKVHWILFPYTMFTYSPFALRIWRRMSR
jgi:hypothetical protein